METEWNPLQVWQRILHAARSAHDVIIYLTAYAAATPPPLQWGKLLHAQIRTDTLQAANSKLYDVSAIIMPDLMCRDEKEMKLEMELVYQREF